MADETNKISGASLEGNIKAAKEQLDLVTQTRKQSGDYLNILKDAQSSLSKIIGSYETLEGKIESLNRSAINTKEINRALTKIKESDINLQKKINELQKANAEKGETQKNLLSDYYTKQSDIKKIEEKIVTEKQAAIEAENALIKYKQDNADLINQIKQEEEELHAQLQYARESGNKDLLETLRLEGEGIRQKKASLTELEKGLNKAKESADLSSRQLEIEKSTSDTLFSNLDVEQQALVSNLKAQEILKKQLEYAQKKLQEEEKLKKSIGVTGFLAGQFSEKLGLGNRFYEKMVQKTRETNKELTLAQKTSILWNSATESIKEKYSDLKKDPAAIALAIVGVYKSAEKGLTYLGNKASAAAQGVANFMSMTGTQAITKLSGGISNLVGKLPLVGGFLSGIVDGFTTLLQLSLEEDDKVTKIGRELNVSKTEATAINDRFLKISINSGKALISAQALVASQKELSNELGVTNILSDEILQTNIELGKLGGVDAKTRAAIAASSTITGESAKGITESVLGQVGALKAATGISFNYQKILSEASSLGGSLGLQFAKYPDKLTKALLTTKSLGLELSKLDSMADSFLDFESSISKEFEAQLLTGKDINLAKAREAFLNNDLATAAAEITRQTGSAEDFLKMNRIQQEAIAGAMGMSRDAMADMLKQQELLNKLGAKDVKDAQAKVEALKAEGYTRDEIIKKIGEEAYQNLTNASAQEKIAGFIEKIQGAVANFLSKSPIVPIVERVIDWLSEPSNIATIVETVQSTFATIFDIVGSVAAAVMKIANFFGADISEDLIEKAKSGGDIIRSMDLSASVGPAENKQEKIKGQNPESPATNISDSAIRGSIGGYSSSDSESMKRTSESPTLKVYNSFVVDPITGQVMVKTVLGTPNIDGSTGVMSKQTKQ